MRAKLVNFERGLDPKRFMDIGKSRRVKDMYEKILTKIELPENIQLLREFAIDLTLAIPERLRAEAGWGNTDQIFDLLSNEEFEEIKRVIEQYFNILEQ